MLLPVLERLALDLGLNPLLLMVPPVVAVSYAFLLPVSTGVNTIVYAVSGLTTAQGSGHPHMTSIIILIFFLACPICLISKSSFGPISPSCGRHTMLMVPPISSPAPASG